MVHRIFTLVDNHPLGHLSPHEGKGAKRLTSSEMRGATAVRTEAPGLTRNRPSFPQTRLAIPVDSGHFSHVPILEQRVDKVEQALAELAHAQLRTEMALHSMARDTEAFKQEMREFKDEMRAFKEESRLERKRMNKAWGDLANKMGTVAEDIVAPNIPRFARDEFGVTGDTDLASGPTRVSRRGEPRRRQFDVVCAGDRKVFVVEVKSTPDREKILEFVGKLKEFDDFFPEYEGWDTYGFFASWSLPDELRGFIAQQGLYGLAMGEETMDIVVRPA